MPYVEKTIASGDYLEIERYYVTPGDRKALRRRDRSQSEDAQQTLNDRNSRKKLIRAIRCNFRPGKDLLVGLTHNDCPDEETAKRRFKNFLDCLRRVAKKLGIAFKAIFITEKQGQWHHHVITSGIPAEMLYEKWAHGRIWTSPLNDFKDYEDLAMYLTAQKKESRKDPEIENAKEPRSRYARRWSCTRNLNRPDESTKAISEKKVRSDPAAPKNYQLKPEWNMGCDARGNRYQKYACVWIGDGPSPYFAKREKGQAAAVRRRPPHKPGKPPRKEGER